MALNDWYEKYKIDVAAALKKGRAVPKEGALRCTLVKLKDNTFRVCCHVSTSRVGAMVRDAKTAGSKVVSSGLLYKGDNGPTFEVDEGDKSCKAKFAAAAAEAAGAPMSVFILAALPAEAAPAAPDPGELFRQRLKNVLPHYNASIKAYPDRMTALRPLMTQLVALGNAGKYAEAMPLLEQVEQGLRALPPLPPPPPPAPPPEGKAPANRVNGKQFLKRVKEVLPRYQEMFPTAPEKMAPLRPLVLRILDLVKGRQYAEALPLLERVEKGLLAVARGEEKLFSAEEDFRDVLAALKDPMKEAVEKGGPAARAIKLGVSEALTLSRQGDFEAALARLEDVEKRIAAALGLSGDDTEKAAPAKPAPARPAAKGPSLATLRKCGLVWGAATKKVEAELEKLRQWAGQGLPMDGRTAKITAALPRISADLGKYKQEISEKLN